MNIRFEVDSADNVERNMRPPMDKVITVPFSIDTGLHRQEGIIYVCTSPFVAGTSRAMTANELKMATEEICRRLTGNTDR